MCWLLPFFCCFCRNPNWWRRRTKLERGLIVSIILILIVGIVYGLGIYYAFHPQSGGDPNAQPTSMTPEASAVHGDTTTMNKLPATGGTKGKADAENICLTKECIHTASTVISKIKFEVEPCDNFFEFACGSYVEEENIPDDKVAISTFSVISDKLQQQLKEIITADRPDSEPKHYRLPNLLYRACMNKSEYPSQLYPLWSTTNLRSFLALIEDLGTEPITKIAKELGGWPLIEGDMWNADNSWTWQEQVKKFRTAGFSMDYIIDFSIGVDLQNSTKRIIDVSWKAYT